MELFFGHQTSPSHIALEESDARHCAAVLRHKAGDAIWCSDGKGNKWKIEIDAINKNKVEGIILEHRVFERIQPFVHLVIGVAKHQDRWEWLIEKLTEFGINRITPIITRHTERKNINEDRLRKIMVAAMKQSNQAWLPQLDAVCTFEQFLAHPHHPPMLIAHNDAAISKSLVQNAWPSDGDTCALIGPEGGFSNEEIELALAKGAKAWWLGETRLRLETAAIGAAAILRNR